MFKQYYKCNLCGLTRYIKYDESTTPLMMLNSIKKDHETHSPACPWNVNNITIFGADEKPISLVDAENACVFFVAGVQFNEGKTLLSNALLEKYPFVGNGMMVHLYPEPDNPHDPNAIKILLPLQDTFYKLGYVPKDHTSKVHEKFKGYEANQPIIATIVECNPEQVLWESIKVIVY